MKHKRIILSIGGALLFMGAVFRPGCRIILNGTVMPGIYEPAAVTRCAAAAVRTAEEITRMEEEVPFTVVPVLCLQRDQPDEELLYHVLLEAYEGVEKLYEVSAQGQTIGMAQELRDIYQLRQAYPELDIQFKECYTYAGAESDMAAMREALRVLDNGVTEVF